MKKLLLPLAIASLTACGGGGSNSSSDNAGGDDNGGNNGGGSPVVKDTTAPVLTNLTRQPAATTRTRVEIAFNTSEAGKVAIQGKGCVLAANQPDATEGDNKTEIQLTEGAGHYNCSIAVTDAAGNQSEFLALPQFQRVLLQDLTATAYIGPQDTRIELPPLPLAYEFYRSREENCDLANYNSCEQGQLDVTSGEVTLVDSALTTTKAATYALRVDGNSAKATIETRDTWGGRQTWDMTPVNLNGKLFLLNGLFQSKIWSSDDGINWTEVEGHNLENRVFTDAKVFKERIWVLGGRINGNDRSGDVWSSADGKTWRRDLSTSSAAFGPREFHQLAVYDNALWLIGGRNSSIDRKDVWKSGDGVNWTQVTADTGMSTGLYDHQVVAVEGDGMYVFYNNHFRSDPRVVEVWKSQNGKDWNKLSEIPHRTDYSVAHKDGRLYVIGGVRLEASNAENNILTSSDGITWSGQQATGAFEGFKNSDVIVFKDRFWRYGGLSVQSGGSSAIKTSKDGIEWRIPQTIKVQFPR